MANTGWILSERRGHPNIVPALLTLNVLYQVENFGARVRFLRTVDEQRQDGMGTAPQATLGL